MKGSPRDFNCNSAALSLLPLHFDYYGIKECNYNAINKISSV